MNTAHDFVELMQMQPKAHEMVFAYCPTIEKFAVETRIDDSPFESTLVAYLRPRARLNRTKKYIEKLVAYYCKPYETINVEVRRA